jgi:hypothetical protein
MWKCKHCKQQFDFYRTTDKANHGKHCDKNPKREDSYKRLKKSLQNRFDNEFGKIENFEVVCNCCGNNFYIKERTKLFPTKQKYFCSRKCSNSVGGKAKSDKYHYDEVATYVTICWRYHDKKCVVCDETNIVAVHHLNENHSDNRKENLIPLCPTHHHYMHSKYKKMIEQKVYEYIKNKWG